jgi:peptide/nickel transport system substrate-binding protein
MVQRTLVLVGGRAPGSVAGRPLRDDGGAGRPRATLRALNAGLALNDERDVPRPYLAEALPQLNTETWRVLPDGRMETTYRLRPNLTWHDGQPFGAEDFVFSHKVYSSPEFGQSSSPPFNYIEEVQAPDPRTVLVRWRQPFADAAGLQMTEFPPLPRHLLEAQFAQGSSDAFVSLPFWVTDYVGLGPYKLTRTELGSFAEVTAFDGHALGRAKIDQIRLVWITDPNTVLANLLSDVAHVATDNSIDLLQAVVLDREWGPRTGGTVLRNPVGVRHVNVQLRPEYATPRTLQDIRVRQALAHAFDRQALVDGITEGLGAVADTFVLPQVEYFATLDRMVVKYPHDLRRAEQLMNDAGYTKGTDGIFTSATDGRFALEVAVAQGARNDTEVAVAADGLKRAGIDSSIRIIPRAQITEPWVLAHFPGVLIGSHNRASQPPLDRMRVAELATAESRGRGANYSGWNNREAERLIGAYETALDRTERTQHVSNLLRLVSEEVPILPLYYNLEFLAHAGGLRGPVVAVTSDAATWNLHEWYWER